MNGNATKRIRAYRKNLVQLTRYALTRRELSPVRFILLSRARSGSTALVSLLDSLPHVRCEGEILNQPVLFPYLHVLARCANSRAGVYGCKILSYHIKKVQPIANRENFIRRLHECGFQIIYLKRENLAQQALSNMRGRKFGFHENVRTRSEAKALEVDPLELIKQMRGSENMNRFERQLLEGIPHLPLTYEEHLAFEAVHQSTVDLVCDFLGIEPSEARCGFRKSSPRSLRDSIANYDELVEKLKDTPYFKYLDADTIGSPAESTKRNIPPLLD